jgi:hypothetical protein
LIVAAALGCLPLHTEYATPWTWSQCARSIAREDEAVPDESGHGRPRHPPQPNGKKPCDADRHAGWSHLADKAPRPLVFGGDRSEVEFAGDPSNEPRRPAGEKPTVRVGRARGGRRQCETRKRPSVRAHRRECATRQSCTREHHATVEAAPLRAASPSRPGLGVERRRPLLQPSIFVTAAAALSRSPSLRRTPCRSRRRKGSFTRPGVIPSAIAPVRCEEETRPVSSAAPASTSSGDIRASLL